jgi:hypothetical protein
MKTYNLASCETLISKYVNDYKGTASVLNEGTLGLGTILLHSAAGMKTIVIKEFFINSWSSGHSVRKYNKVPKKYQIIIDNKK